MTKTSGLGVKRLGIISFSFLVLATGLQVCGQELLIPPPAWGGETWFAEYRFTNPQPDPAPELTENTQLLGQPLLALSVDPLFGSGWQDPEALFSLTRPDNGGAWDLGPGVPLGSGEVLVKIPVSGIQSSIPPTDAISDWRVETEIQLVRYASLGSSPSVVAETYPLVESGLSDTTLETVTTVSGFLDVWNLTRANFLQDLNDSGEDLAFRIQPDSSTGLIVDQISLYVRLIPAPKAPDPTPLLIAGKAIDGYVAGGTVWLDSNLNESLDPGEPTTTTDHEGGFNLEINLSDYDLDGDGILEPGEAVLYITGGTDISTRQNRVTSMSAPPGTSVISPLTTLLERQIRLNPAVDPSILQSRLLEALNLPEVDLINFDPVREAAAGSSEGLAVYSAGVQLSDTIEQISTYAAEAAGVSIDTLSRDIWDTISQKASDGFTINVEEPEQVQDLIQQAATRTGVELKTEDVVAVSSIVSVQNQLKKQAQTAATPESALVKMAQLQVVSQSVGLQTMKSIGRGEIFASEATSLFSVENVEQMAAKTSAGNVGFGDPLEAPEVKYEFLSDEAVITEGGRSISPLYLSRKNGLSTESSAIILLTESLSGMSETLQVHFDAGATMSLIDFSSIDFNDNSPDGDKLVELTITNSGFSEVEISEAQVTSALMVIDDDSSGVIRFSDPILNSLDLGSIVSQVEIQRQAGLKGEIHFSLLASYQTATSGENWINKSIEGVFQSGQSQVSVQLRQLEEAITDIRNPVHLELRISDASGAGEGDVEQGKSIAVVNVHSGSVNQASDVQLVISDKETTFEFQIKGQSNNLFLIQISYDLVQWKLMNSGSTLVAGETFSIDKTNPEIRGAGSFFRLVESGN